MGGVVLGILVWQEGGEAVGALIAVGVVALAALAWWLRQRKREGKPTLIDAGPLPSKYFRLGISRQTLQQIALGGLMIALPIFLQMVLEYAAMGAGLSLAPLSLTHVRRRAARREEGGRPQPEQDHPRRLPAARRRHRGADPDRSARRFRLGDGDPAR